VTPSSNSTVTMTTPKPSVVEALSAVMDTVREVRKNERNQSQGFNFRGIDAVINAVGPALRKHGVVVVPFAESIEYETYATKGGTAMKSCVVRVRYVFYGPAGDTIETVVYGESSDAGDKSTPKAHSVAFRTALLQALCIPTDDPDPDEQSHERVVTQAQPRPFDLVRFVSACASENVDPLDVVAHAALDKTLEQLTTEDRPLLLSTLAELLKGSAVQPAESESEPGGGSAAASPPGSSHKSARGSGKQGPEPGSVTAPNDTEPVPDAHGMLIK